MPPGDARENTIAYQVLRAHDQSNDPGQMCIRFDALISQDLTYVGIIQTARKSGMSRFSVPYALTNCHNSLCAVGGTINADDHAFGLSAAKKYGGIYVPANLSVMHAYAREELSKCGNMILGSDSHSRYGATGTMGFGEGGPELVKQLLERTYDIPAPEIILCYLSGSPKRGVGPEDIALAIIGDTFKKGSVKNKIMEFTGPGLVNLSADFRNNIDTMMTETSCLSSIWETDGVIEQYYRIHGRPDAYRKLTAKSPAYYDGVLFIELDAIEPMIALPFHPSNVFTIHEFQRNAKDILSTVDEEADRLFGKENLRIGEKLRNGKVYADQGSIAGCAAGLFDNIQEAAAILFGRSIGREGFSLTIYPTSMPINLALMRTGALEKLLSAGVIIKPCICGPCSGYGDIPANNAFSIRHATRNFPNREGSIPFERQYASVALMDARSIAATAANGGVITAAIDVEYEVPQDEYSFDRTSYEKRIFYGFGKGDPEVKLITGPNITDFPPIEPLAEHILMELTAIIHDEVTTTDELIPSGDTASYRSNPIRLADYALCRRVPGYADLCRGIQAVEYERLRGSAPQKLMDLLSRVGSAEKLIRVTQYGSCLFAHKPGDGSAREQAASSQKILGGLANICYEYATKRYRSNCINWGLIPFTLPQGVEFTHQPGEWIYVQEIREAITAGRQEIEGVVLKADGTTETILLKLERLTQDEKDILLLGCLMNYYRKQKEKEETK